eukprot:1833604-Heterocapsa_arctica.AAC.1
MSAGSASDSSEIKSWRVRGLLLSKASASGSSTIKIVGAEIGPLSASGTTGTAIPMAHSSGASSGILLK